MGEYNKQIIRYKYAPSSSKLFPRSQPHCGLVVYVLEYVYTLHVGYCTTRLYKTSSYEIRRIGCMLLLLILYIMCVLQLFTSEDSYEQILSCCQKGSPNCLFHWRIPPVSCENLKHLHLIMNPKAGVNRMAWRLNEY